MYGCTLIKQIGVAILLFGLLSGCARGPVTWFASYDPIGGQHLQTIEPLSVMLTVADRRPGPELNYVGVSVDDHGAQSPFTLSTPPTTVLFHAFSKEFESAGHTLMRMPIGDANIVMAITLSRFWCLFWMNLFRPVITGTIVAEVALLDGKDHLTLVSKSISGRSHEARWFWLADDKDAKRIMEKTLNDFMLNVFKDPDINAQLQMAADRMSHER